jgi:DNA invertase Pin-like site-specific DNA recombinase
MMKPKAYSYTRFSTPEQRLGDSLRRQIERATRYAERKGLEIAEYFHEKGMSGFRGANVEGKLKLFLGAVDRNEILSGSYLLVESMDRLSRDKVNKALKVLNDIIEKGITVVTLDDERVYSKQTIGDDHIALIVALLNMARAHEESKRKSDMLGAVWGNKKNVARDDKKAITRVVPAWLYFDDVKKKIEVNKSRKAVVLEIFKLIREGWGAYSIARLLNERGEPPWGNRKGAVWHESYIKKIAKNRSVLGEYQPHKYVFDDNSLESRIPDGGVIKGYFPPIMTEEQFAAAAISMARRRTGGRGRKGIGYSNLFTGLLKCRCSSGYRYIDKGVPPKGGQYLQCTVSKSKARGKCNAPPFRYEVVEDVIFRALETLDIDRILGGSARNVRIGELESEASMLTFDLSNAEQKLASILEALSSGSVPIPKSITAVVSKLEKERDAIAKRLYETDSARQDLLRLDPEQHKTAVTNLMREIRSANGKPQNVGVRRALVAELQRVLERVTITPIIHIPWEIIEEDPNWKVTYDVPTEEALERLCRRLGFEMNIVYRNGEVHYVRPIEDKVLRMRFGRKMQLFKLLAAEP